MRRTVLLLASVGLAVLLTSGIVTAQEEGTTLPETTISDWERPLGYDRYTTATFSFSSSEANSTFECKIDSGAFGACSSPKRYYLLQEGPHTFQVRAKDAAGNVDLTPAEYTWEIDTTDPKFTWLQKPGNPITRSYSITRDRTPTWGYTISDKNLTEGAPVCSLSRAVSGSKYEHIVLGEPCTSPTTFPFSLPDGIYAFGVGQYDKAYNNGSGSMELEVDTVPPRFLSGNPTGKTVWRYANVVVEFNDHIIRSAKFVNIYRTGTSTPLAVYRYGDATKKITLDPTNALKPGTWYTVKVTTGVNDGANKLAAPKTWHFKTK